MGPAAFSALALGLALTPALAQGGDAAAAVGSDAAALKAVHGQIINLIGEPRCNNLVHCRVLPLGARPCGGPSEYLAFSSMTANRETLESQAYEYTFLEEEANRSKSAVGSCEVLPQPRVDCISGRCTLSSDRK